MNQQPDKLFKEKLEGYQRPIPASAWNKVEANLDKKKNKAVYLKVAAAILLLAMASVLLYSLKSPASLTAKLDNESKITTEQKPSVNHSEVKPQKITKEPEIAAKEIDTEPVQNATTKNAATRKSIPLKQKKTVVDERKKTQNVAAIHDQQLDASEVLPRDTINYLHEEISVAQNSNKHQSTSVKIVYTLEEVNEKYLDKKALAEATSDGKKSSRLKKLLEKAYDLKHNQDPLGELRQKKNELLALNFKRK